MFTKSKLYRMEPQILYNQVNTESLYGAIIHPDKIAVIGGEKMIVAGSFLASGGGLVKRSRTLSPYKGDGKLFVNNPYPFAPGDIIRVIGTPKSDQIAEYQAVIGGTARTLGTVTRVVGDSVSQITRITINSIAKGNILCVCIEGVFTYYIAQTSSVKQAVTGLRKALTNYQGGMSILDLLEFTETDTALDISYKQGSGIFATWAVVEKGEGATNGAIAVEVVKGVGQIEFTPDPAAPATLPLGSKVGTISDIPLGIIAHNYSLTDSEGEARPADLAAYNKAMIYKRALPYLDGHLVTLPTLGLTYMPAYGAVDDEQERLFELLTNPQSPTTTLLGTGNQVFGSQSSVMGT